MTPEEAHNILKCHTEKKTKEKQYTEISDEELLAACILSDSYEAHLMMPL